MADHSRRQRVLPGIMMLSVCTLLAASSQAATLTWSPSGDTTVIGYVVYIGTASGEYSSTVDVGSQTWYQFTPSNPAAMYYMAIRAYTADGRLSDYSEEVQSLPTGGVAPPSANTGEAASITALTATLTGVGNPNGSSTSGYFQYGVTAQYGSSTPVVDLGSGTVAAAIGNGDLTGLACATLYHFRAVATNAGDTAYGADATFSTNACSMLVTTGSPISIRTHATTLTAEVKATEPVTVWFEYGVTTDYGSTSPTATLGVGAGSVATPVSGLNCDTVYHFRAVATSSTGPTYGADSSFRTEWCGHPSAQVPIGVPDATTLLIWSVAPNRS